MMNSDYFFYKGLLDKQVRETSWCGHCAMLRNNLMPFQKRIFLEFGAIGISSDITKTICPKCRKIYTGYGTGECGNCTLKRLAEEKDVLEAPSTTLLSCLCL